MIEKIRNGYWQNSDTCFGTYELWKAHFDVLVETETHWHFLEQAVVDGNYGAVLSVNKNGSTSFGNTHSNSISCLDNETIERKLASGDYLEISVDHESEVEKDCS